MALELLVTAPVVTEKLAEVDDAATVTDAGVVRAALLSESKTLAPPVGAGCVRVTVQVLDELAMMLSGLQVTDETKTGAARLIEVLADVLLYAAVIVAVELLATADVEAAKVADLEAAGTVTDPGTLRAASLLVSAMLAPPLGADCVRVTVHVLEAFGPRLVGVHESEDISTGATRLTDAVAELLL